MNAPTTRAVDIACDTAGSSPVAFSLSGKGLHYDWRGIIAAAEASDLDIELAALTRSSELDADAVRA